VFRGIHANASGALRGTLIALLVCSAGTAWQPVAADESRLSAAEERGKAIFRVGESVSGAPITAVVAGNSTPLPASILPCSGCHGDDGLGRPEGGVRPPDITWPALTAASGHQHEFGRSHPAFDAAAVAAAISQGIDPGGNTLDAAMPRYSMTEADLHDLIAYLKRIDADLDPGLGPESVTVASLLPTRGQLATVGAAMRQVIEAVFADINASGGIHGRRIELTVADQADDPQASIWQLRDLLQRGSVFALVGGYGTGMERDLATIAEDFEVPLIGPYTLLPRAGDTGERHTFYLTGGLIEQARVLVRHVLQHDVGTARIAIVHATGPLYEATVAAARDQLESQGGQLVTEVAFEEPYFDAVAIADALDLADIDTILLLTSADGLARISDELGRRGRAPTLLMPGVFAGQRMFDLSSQFTGRVFVGYSTTPDDHSAEGIREFEALHTRHGFGYEHSSAQIAAYGAARVFIEALKRAGHDVSREKLLAALEGLSEFHTGLMPPLSFGRKYRIGAYGGYIVEIDMAAGNLIRGGDWISLRL